MWKEIPPFSFSAGERKIMAHFVVRKGSVHGCIPAAEPPENLHKLRKRSSSPV